MAHIGKTYNTGGHPGAAVSAAGTHGCNAICKLDLAKRPQVQRAAGPGKRLGFYVNRSNDIVPGVCIRQIIIQQIGQVRTFEQMKMSVDNGQAWINYRFISSLISFCIHTFFYWIRVDRMAHKMSLLFRKTGAIASSMASRAMISPGQTAAYC
ncbi:hypothetical protein D3C86_1709880 [compost metagenome]